MFKAEKIAENFKNLIGWRQHHNTSDIEIATELTETESGEYYQQKHSALKLNYIRATIEDDKNLDDYLVEKVRDASVEMLNDVFTKRMVNKYGKTLLGVSQLLNKYGWVNDKIMNENRFVGFQVRLFTGSGLQAIINKIGFQMSGAVDFKLYVFHTSKVDPIKTIDVSVTQAGQWHWENTDLELNSFTYDLSGGAFIIGYYQEDLGGVNAINNTDFDFDKGACGGCNASNYTTWRNITKYYSVYPLYVASGNYEKGKMFDLNDAFYIATKTFGLNLKMSVRCDLTTFFIENKFVLKNLLAYKVTSIILNDMKFSCETNYIEENLKMMILRDIEGDTETRMGNIGDKYDDELHSVLFNISGLNQKCLPCEDDGYSIEYGTV